MQNCLPAAELPTKKRFECRFGAAEVLNFDGLEGGEEFRRNE